jgi:ankyrin repeat protein
MKEIIEINFPVDDYERNILHIAINEEKSNEDILTLIEKYPNAVNHCDKDGFYPLQYAIIFLRYDKVALKLLDEYPQLAKEKDIDCRYPFNLALEFTGNDEPYEKFVMKLLGEFPQAIQEKDYNGSYPLHLACQDKRSEKIFLKLISDFPQAIASIDNYDRYPLHYACECAQSESVVFKLMNLFPEAASKKTHCNSYPIDFAYYSNYSDRFMLALINLNLMAVKARGNRRWYCDVEALNHSSTLAQVLETLKKKSDYEIQNRIDIPKLVTIHGLENLRRNDTFQWVLDSAIHHPN